MKRPITEKLHNVYIVFLCHMKEKNAGEYSDWLIDWTLNHKTNAEYRIKWSGFVPTNTVGH